MAVARPVEVSVRAQVDAELRRSRADVAGAVFRSVLLFTLLFALLALLALLTTTWTDAEPVLTSRLGDFLDAPQSPNNLPTLAGVSQGLRGSFWIAVMVIVVSIPLGIAAAVYLEEYAPHNRLTRFIELNIRNLAGVPSVVYGLLGAAIFVEVLGGLSGKDGLAARTLAAGGLTLAVLALPIIIITSSEAIRAVPQGLREGAYGVGATKWEVVRTQVLPYAAPGILTGALLSLARAVGEAAPLIIVGAAASLSGGGLDQVVEPSALTERFTAMPNIIGSWVGYQNEEYRVNNTAAAIIVLLAFVLLLNTAAVLLRNRYEKRRVG
jgi:phosphate transport system permease protein